MAETAIRTLATRSISGMEVVAAEGDITAVEADAVTNAANDHLWMGAGVAGAIKRRAGAIVEEEAVAKGPIPVGAAVETGAGALRHLLRRLPGTERERGASPVPKRVSA